MKIFAISFLVLATSFSANGADVVPGEICGLWSIEFNKKLRWDHSYEAVSVLMRSDGRCHVVMSPPPYAALLLIKKTEKPDEYIYQIEDKGKVVEDGILHYDRTADALSFKILGTDVRLIRDEKLKERMQNTKGREHDVRLKGFQP